MSEKAKHTFQAEVQQVLDIVINSLYTDKDIFVRELVSNASDALEKLRHLQHTEKNIHDPKAELEIRITTDEEAKTLTIEDRGIGMDHEELVENLGTIAHSGSKAFLKAMAEGDQKNSNVIGQFGVGFYSAFMVADEVEVHTHSWKQGTEQLVWKSDGKSGYEIESDPEEGSRGSRIVLKLKEDCEEFAKEYRIKTILETYSAFVPFPIFLNEERVNKVEALWLKSKSEISDEEYAEFYKFQGKAFDEPRYRLHFSADAPLAINALLFVPNENPEFPGMGEIDPGVALYCRKILIDDKPEGLLPKWLRFIKGVIDSEDLPLNISREAMQDSSLVRKLGEVITKRFLKFLDKQATDDPDGYKEFYERFSRFLKEGVAVDFAYREQLGKLLRYESSLTGEGEIIGMETYIERAKDGQEEIFYQIAPNRAAIEAGPYLETFKARGLEVLFMYEPIDEYVMGSLPELQGKKLVAVDRADIDFDKYEADVEPEGEPLAEKDSTRLVDFLKKSLGERVKEVRISKRLVDSPVAALQSEGAMSPQMRQMMRAMNQEMPGPDPVELELNPRHALVRKLAQTCSHDEELAGLVADQLYDNALLSAGLLEDSKDMVSRLNTLLEKAMG
jgi:molecular chaperone HtpG